MRNRITRQVTEQANRPEAVKYGARPIMPSQTDHFSSPKLEHRPSIRDRLERDAWKRFPELARKLEQRRRARYQGFAPPAVYRWQNRSLLVLCLLVCTLFLLRAGTAEAADEDWGLKFLGDGEQQQAVAFDTLIDADINGLVARVDVHQRFRNTGRSWSEAVYRFPLPVGAAVDRLQIQAGDRVIEGVIQERDIARRQYQQARSRGVIAALLEQQRPNQFETRLANIGPGEEISIAISFLVRVDFDEGQYSLQIPLTFTPRWDAPGSSLNEAQGSENFSQGTPLDDHRLEVHLKLRSALDLAHIESRFHDMDIHPTLGGYDLVLLDPDTRTDRMFELNWAPSLGTAPQAALSTFDDGESVYALLMLAPPLAEETVPQDREVVFIIDTSGSMQGLALRQAKAALYQGLSWLEPDDRFNLVEFNSTSYTLFPGSVAPDGSYLEEALNFIDDLEADGGTNMSPALKDAMTLPAQPSLFRQIVFVTDGSIGNEEQLLQQIAADLGDSRLFTVSIGSAPNTGFMRKAAAIGRGSHTHIGQLEDVAENMNKLWQRIESPALQNIEVDWGVPADFYPEIIPDLYAGEPLWLVARLERLPGQVHLSGDLNGERWEQETGPHPGAGSDNLATLWARARIEALQDSRLFMDTDAEAVRQNIIDLALEFGLLTPYTSLVAVDNTPVRPAGESLAQNDIPNLLPAGSSSQLSGFSSTATGWQGQLAGALTLLLLAASMLWFSTPSHRPRFSPPDLAGGSPRRSQPLQPVHPSACPRWDQAA
jgi:Ca-activated chloride channel family protein